MNASCEFPSLHCLFILNRIQLKRERMDQSDISVTFFQFFFSPNCPWNCWRILLKFITRFNTFSEQVVCDELFDWFCAHRMIKSKNRVQHTVRLTLIALCLSVDVCVPACVRSRNKYTTENICLSRSCDFRYFLRNNMSWMPEKKNWIWRKCQKWNSFSANFDSHSQLPKASFSDSQIHTTLATDQLEMGHFVIENSAIGGTVGNLSDIKCKQTEKCLSMICNSTVCLGCSVTAARVSSSINRKRCQLNTWHTFSLRVKSGSN